jgi:hypothetical protein
VAAGYFVLKADTTAPGTLSSLILLSEQEVATIIAKRKLKRIDFFIILFLV